MEQDSTNGAAESKPTKSSGQKEPWEVTFDSPEPATPPMILINLDTGHEMVREDIEHELMECSCGLRTQGPEYKRVMADHIANDWD